MRIPLIYMYINTHFYIFVTCNVCYTFIYTQHTFVFVLRSKSACLNVGKKECGRCLYPILVSQRAKLFTVGPHESIITTRNCSRLFSLWTRLNAVFFFLLPTSLISCFPRIYPVTCWSPCLYMIFFWVLKHALKINEPYNSAWDNVFIIVLIYIFIPHFFPALIFIFHSFFYPFFYQFFLIRLIFIFIFSLLEF